MGSISRPTAISSTGWAGAYTDLADDSDLTYVLRADPDASDPLLVTMAPLTNPGATNGHNVIVRAAALNDEADPLACQIEVLDGDTNTVIATFTASLTETPTDLTFVLSSTQASLFNYDNPKVRLTGIAADTTTQDVAFVWDAVTGADSYVLQIGRTLGTADVFNADVGYVLTYTVTLNGGTYYSRVVPYRDAVAGTPTDWQTVTV